MRGESTTILKYHNKPTKRAEPQTNTGEGFTSRLSFTPASPLPSPFHTKISSFRAPLHRVKEKVNITEGEAFTHIYLPISYLRRILTQTPNTTTFTRIILLINRLLPKGEEVNTKNRKHLTRTRARKASGNNENKRRMGRKSSTLVEEWRTLKTVTRKHSKRNTNRAKGQSPIPRPPTIKQREALLS